MAAQDDLDMLIAECFDTHSGKRTDKDVHDAIMQIRGLYSMARLARGLMNDAKADPSGSVDQR